MRVPPSLIVADRKCNVVSIRHMNSADLERIAEIDRSEHITGTEVVYWQVQLESRWLSRFVSFGEGTWTSISSPRRV